MLDRADGLLYSPLLAGLADVTYRYKSSRQPKVVVEVRWMKPDLVSSSLLLEPGAGAGTRRWAEASGSSHLKNVTHLVDLVVRPPTRSQYEGDEILLESERRVRVVARSERSLARSLIEALITFGPNGLPVHMEMQTATSVITLGPTYRRGPEGRWLVDTETGEPVTSVRWGIYCQLRKIVPTVVPIASNHVATIQGLQI